MIFGEQKDVKAVTLQPSEGPDDLRAKMEEAISTFENQDEVLFLVDLWSGTPFNQANLLLNGHEDHWAIVTGLNSPMLIEAYAMRMSTDSAHEIATHICEVARDGVNIRPEELEPKKEEAVKAEKPAPARAIPEGTVLGDGHIKYVLARVDTRLLHGQVATTWTKSTQPTRIIVVSDAVSKDALRKQMIEQAAPPGVKANVVPIKKMIEVAKDSRFGATKALLLFETPQDASILSMFIIGSLVQRWVSISFTPVVSRVTQSEGAYIDWSQIKGGAEGIKSALTQYASLGATGLDKVKVTTLQQNLDQLIPGLAALLLTLLCCWLLKKKVDLTINATSYLGMANYGKVMVGDEAFEYYNDKNVNDYIQIPWSEVTGIMASVMFKGKWIPRFAVVTKNNGNFIFSTRDNKKTLRAVRNYVDPNNMVRSLSFFQVISRGLKSLFKRK